MDIDNLFEVDELQNPFLTQPDLVVYKLLNLLDHDSKINLRLVCKTTKSWIASTTKFLQKFQVPINSSQDFENVLNSSEQWCNLDFKSQINLFDSEILANFLTNYKDYLTVLRFSEFTVNQKNLAFIRECFNLQSLSITTFQFDPLVDELIDSFVFDKLGKLCLQIINFEKESELVLYAKFLSCCPNLEHLEIPRPQPESKGHPNLEVTWVNLKRIQLELIIQPVMNYLVDRQSNPKNCDKSSIKILDVQNVFSRHFGPLAETCLLTGTLLLNVNDKQVKYLFLTSEDVLQNILSIRENIDDRRPLLKWCNLKRMFIRTSRCDVRNYYDDNLVNFTGGGINVINGGFNGINRLPAVTLPRLKSVHLVFDSMSRTDMGFVRLYKIVRLLIKTYRPNVEELTLQWPEFCHDTPVDVIDVYDVIRNFPGLRVLKFIGWGRRICKEEHEGILRQGLTQLKSIQFEW